MAPTPTSTTSDATTADTDDQSRAWAAPGGSAEEIAGRLRLSATRLARKLRQEAQTGLTPTQLSALAAVERHGPVTLGALADLEQVAPPSVTRVVAKLETDGLLTRQPDPADRRVTRVVVTQKGRNLLGTSRRRKTEWLTTRLEDLAADQRARLAGRARHPRCSHLGAPMKIKFRRGVKDTFRSLHVRNFRLFFSGQLISQIGNWLTMVALTLLVLKLTDNGVAIGFLAAAEFGPVLLIGAWAGLIADRSDKRKLLIIVQSIAMAQSFALAALAFSGSPPLWAIYAVALVGGFTVAFDNPARRAFVVEMVPKEDMNNAVSLNSAAMTSSRIFGPALAGLLVDHGRLRLGVPRRRPLVHRGAASASAMMRTSELHPSPIDGAGEGPGARRAPLRAQRPRPLGAARDDGGRRHLRLQLPDRLPAVRHPQPRRQRHHLHPAALGDQRRCAGRRARYRAPQVDRRARGRPDVTRLRRRDDR